VGDGPQPVTSYDQDYISNPDIRPQPTCSRPCQAQRVTLTRVQPPASVSRPAPPLSRSKGYYRPIRWFWWMACVSLRFPAFPFPQEYGGSGPLSFVDLNSIPVSRIDLMEF